MHMNGRRIRRFRILTGLLLAAVCARSLIAPGFMLDTRRAFDGTFPITVCHGLNGMETLAGLMPKARHGAHHGAHHERDPAAPHFTAACGLWYAGTSFISVACQDFDFSLSAGRDRPAEPPRISYSGTHKRTQFARAPPVPA